MKKKNRLLLILAVLVVMMAYPLTANAAIKINKKSISIFVKKTYKLKVTGTKKTVKWSSSNKNVATVSKKGVVKGIGRGICKIKAKVGKKQYTCKVTVKIPVKQVRFFEDTYSVYIGDKLKLEAIVSPEDANKKSLTWKSSNTKVATVTSKGVVKGISEGKATITAKAKDGSGKKASCIVTVEEDYSKAEPIDNYYVTINITEDNFDQYYRMIKIDNIQQYTDYKMDMASYDYYIIASNAYAKGLIFEDASIYAEEVVYRLDGTTHNSACLGVNMYGEILITKKGTVPQINIYYPERGYGPATFLKKEYVKRIEKDEEGNPYYLLKNGEKRGYRDYFYWYNDKEKNTSYNRHIMKLGFAYPY